MNTHGIARFANKPEVKKVGKDNIAVCNFTLVFEERIKNGNEIKKTPHFLDFEVWDTAAELIAEHFDKGQPIYVVDATPRQQTWETEGQKRSKIVFRLNKFEFVPNFNKKSSEESPA